MPSQLKSDTARANGAKSRGPKSAETRQKSSQNSLRHGFTSRHTLLLECENSDELQQMRDEFAAIHCPATLAEQDLVDEMVTARWRIRRLRSIETVILDCEMVRRKPEVEKQFIDPDPAVHLAMAFLNLAAESASMGLISRYESRLQRSHDRAYRTLRELQQPRKAAGSSEPAPSAPPPSQPAKPENTGHTNDVPKRVPASASTLKNDETNPSAPQKFFSAVSRFLAKTVSIPGFRILESPEAAAAVAGGA